MFEFPEDAHWDPAEEAVAFLVRLGEYEGTVFVPRRLFQSLVGARPSPEQCLQHFHLNRAAFERLAEARICGRQLDADANIRLSGRDLRRAGSERGQPWAD